MSTTTGELPTRPFDSVIVANRGEIAVRVLRAAREAGLRSIAVASEADAGALHTLVADSCTVIGPGPARESYLVAERVLDVARESGAQALHPGYGFFAEDAGFARQVIDAGLVWIGPPPSVIERLGDKVAAKAIARDAGVPVLPGFEGDVDDVDDARAAAEEIGYPLLVKAAAGGGGRGMRSVSDRSKLEEALAGASREAAAAFASGRVFLEKLLVPARHVEVQILCDAHGNAVHLGERECSIQRRHQKIIEESPSPAVNAALRARMGDAAVALVRAVGYVGAGTVEFLLGPDGDFYFLEVNTRLQVEHPVTELVTGLDLVRLQFLVAAGQTLPIGQDEIDARLAVGGHAIEMRVCAEDPAFQFAPQAGRILHLELPQGPGIRTDAGIRAQQDVSAHYDSLLLKLLAHGADRAEATARALRALDLLLVMGPTTNVPYLRAILSRDAFAAGALSTGFLEENLSGWDPGDPLGDEVLVAAVTGELLAGGEGRRAGGNGNGEAHEEPSPWETLPSWRNTAAPADENAATGGDA